ncbi:hypothetical protein [Fuerstiella marisgermanici]|uniref:Uncharacterized protein n=1 Tax=Fuerstiella marisgermanici TaxID=1891926 RepID=A0A1P8WKE4_9PLAN|nr:hypothetical protein [Fuerstiella marisgermanici]APZ94535.1 hypothetical protein Fuma_04167 [Fuerstiella marisgermanici]
MGNAMKHITCSLIGTLLAVGIAGMVAADWVDYKINEVSVMIDQKIADVANAPARAAANTWEAVKEAASDIW